MNFLKLFIAAFSATNIMTTFSYLLSTKYKSLFKEPVIMNFVLQGLGIHLAGRWQKIAGWVAHYIIGLAFVITYETIWRYTSVQFGFVSGIVFGILSGIIGILCWHAVYLLPIHPDVSPRAYYIQLFFGHIIFACAVVVAFKIFKYDPLSRITP